MENFVLVENLVAGALLLNVKIWEFVLRPHQEVWRAYFRLCAQDASKIPDGYPISQALFLFVC